MNKDINAEPFEESGCYEGKDGSLQPENEDEDEDVLYNINQRQLQRF